MIDVKAYKFSDRIIVQYYDSGNRSRLRCPACGGEVDCSIQADDLDPNPREILCPQCDTALGMLSSTFPFEVKQSVHFIP